MACIQPTSGAKQCEASLTVQNQQHQIILVFAIGRTAKDQPQKAVIQVPINIRTAESVRLMVGGDPVLIPFTQCNRLGCFAQLELKNNSLIRRLRAHNVGTPGRIAWHDSTNAEVVAPFSTRGFSAAMDALAAADHGKP